MDDSYPGVVRIDLAAIKHNLKVLQAAAPRAQQMAVVKADAYGHGLIPVSLAALDSGVKWLGTAQLREALALRSGLDQSGIARPDLGGPAIFSWLHPAGPRFETLVPRALAAEIDLSVATLSELQTIISAAEQADSGRPARVHLKIDTGMSRGGSTLEAWPALVQAAVNTAPEILTVVGIWSHLSHSYDLSPAGNDRTKEQVAKFQQALQIAAELGLEPPLRHLAASAGVLWHPETHFDLVRLGVSMYGASPAPQDFSTAQLELIPAMTVLSELMNIKAVEAGQSVSYGGTWQAPTDRWLGLVPLGYADGIFRKASGSARVSINRQSRKTAGRICMDQFVVDLGPVDIFEDELPRCGDPVIIFGDATQDPSVPEATDWANAADTIPHELWTGISTRIPREYLNEPNPEKIL